MMDFVKDKNAWDINDEYLFGRSILVSPVTRPMYIKKVASGSDSTNLEDFTIMKSKEVYLPQAPHWYDFWTGEQFDGGTRISKETPLHIIPLFVKAGSILPLGPQVQYAGEKKWDRLEIRIYPGADGNFVLYEDENDSYNYEKGAYTTINFHWNDKKKELTIDDRQGTFPGMLETRNFSIVQVNAGKGNGIEKTGTPDKLVTYSGKKLVVKL